MAQENTANLLFLLGMMSLGVGCSGSDGDDRSTLGPSMTSAPGVGTDGSADDDDDEGDDGDGDGVATTGPVPGDSGPAATSGGDGPPADAGGDSGTYGGYATYGGYGTYGAVDCSMPVPAGPIGPQCQSYQAKLDECLGAEITPECIEYYTAFCQYDLDYGAMAGGACGSAIEEFWACLSALSCQEFESKAACQAQLMALDTACGQAAPPLDPNRRSARSG